MLTFFQVCFFSGAIFTVASFLLGNIFSLFGSNAEIDLDIDADAGGLGEGAEAPSGDASSDTGTGGRILPLKPGIIAVFFTTFGGVGMIAMRAGYHIVLVFGLSVFIAIIPAYLLFKFIWLPLYKMQGSAVSVKDLVGVKAKTTLGIKENGMGRILYVVDGNTYSAPAKSLEGEDIDKGEEVLICEIKNHIFYVVKN